MQPCHKGCTAPVVGLEPRQLLLLKLVSEYMSLVAWVDSITKNHRGDATVYSGLGRSVPYILQLMILILKRTQNRGVTIECRERFGRGLARC